MINLLVRRRLTYHTETCNKVQVPGYDMTLCHIICNEKVLSKLNLFRSIDIDTIYKSSVDLIRMFNYKYLDEEDTANSWKACFGPFYHNLLLIKEDLQKDLLDKDVPPEVFDDFKTLAESIQRELLNMSKCYSVKTKKIIQYEKSIVANIPMTFDSVEECKREIHLDKVLPTDIKLLIDLVNDLNLKVKVTSNNRKDIAKAYMDTIDNAWIKCIKPIFKNNPFDKIDIHKYMRYFIYQSQHQRYIVRGLDASILNAKPKINVWKLKKLLSEGYHMDAKQVYVSSAKSTDINRTNTIFTIHTVNARQLKELKSIGINHNNTI